MSKGFCPRLDFTNRHPQAKKKLSSNRLHTTTSASKLPVPCRVGCISRPPAGYAQKRVFVSLSADAAAAT
ncbi:hypothetical protein J6590_032984 [Homalodisca vitripennis]|nr:hypothetical protein J6590_032984 [Homalodisca vitripennis]